MRPLVVISISPASKGTGARIGLAASILVLAILTSQLPDSGGVPPTLIGTQRSAPVVSSQTPSSQFNCTGVGEVAGALYFQVPLGGSATLNWYVTVAGCTTRQPMEVLGTGNVVSPPNTSAPRITVSPRYWMAPKGDSEQAIAVTVHMPNAKRDLGVNWTASVSAHHVLSAIPDVAGCSGGGCALPGAAKIYSIVAFNPAIPRPSVSLSSPLAGSVSTPPNISLNASTILPSPGVSGKFVPVVDIRNTPFSNASPNLLAVDVSIANPYGAGNGTLSVTDNGNISYTLSLVRFTGTNLTVVRVSLSPGANLIAATVNLHNGIGSGSANSTLTKQYLDTGFAPVWVNFTVNASVSPSYFGSPDFAIFDQNWSLLLGTYGTSMNTTLSPWTFGPGDVLQFEAKTYLTTVYPGQFTFAVVVGGSMFSQAYTFSSSFPTP